MNKNNIWVKNNIWIKKIGIKLRLKIRIKLINGKTKRLKNEKKQRRNQR
jgi:hypothetical protein